MVYYYKSRCGNYTIYMGKDKYENEHLIKYGLPEDVWFHVDDLSSAHVYLRLQPNQTLDDISDELLIDCCSLVKANSIEGCKKSNVYVVYTRWKNLKKTKDMVDGQVSYFRPENVRRRNIEKNNTIVRQIEKTRIEKMGPNLVNELYEIQSSRQRELQQLEKQNKKIQIQNEKKIKEQMIKEKQERSYDRIFTEDNMITNKQMKSSIDTSAAEEYEDDFF